MQRLHWACNPVGLRQMARELEDANIVSVLLPYGPEGEDFSMYLPDIFGVSKNLKVMLALAAYAVSPEYASKTFYTAQRFGQNRLDLNLVAGRYSDKFAQMALDKYNRSPEEIDTHEKRVSITENWMKKFSEIIKQERYETKLAVVGSSETTIRIANEYADYLIINGWMINDGYLDKLKNTKPILVLDPLILEPGQDPSSIEYVEYEFKKQPIHPIQGTFEEVEKMIKDLSESHKIYDFMIHTDQKDVTKLLKLCKKISSE